VRDAAHHRETVWEEPVSDGNILAARTKLTREVERLCHPQTAVYHDDVLQAPSVYRQLQSDLAGTQGDTRTPAKSLPPLWIDAAQLLSDIDHQTHLWCRKTGETPDLLDMLTRKPFRPQDTDMVFRMAKEISGWTESALSLLVPESVKHISAPCPSCGKAWVYRRDGGGDVVRSPALKVTAAVGCSCQHCEAIWTPDRYMFLCKLLGFDLPEGVLE